MNTDDYFPYGKPFEEQGYHFAAFQPIREGVKRQFVVVVTKDGEPHDEFTVPMMYPNIWGVDVEDIGSLERATDAYIERGFKQRGPSST